MSVINVWVGATNPSGARVIGKITTASASLLVADNSSLIGATTFGPATAANSVVSIEATGLTPGQRYWYSLDDGSDSAPTGTFRTLPAAGSEASFTLGASSCAGADEPVDVEGDVLDPLNVSNHPVFATIRQRAINEEWLAFIHLGDLHYYNLGGSNSAGAATVDNYRRAYDDVLLQPRQQALYRDVPIVHAWDDHDFGPNNSDETAPGRLEAQQVYRERVPSYPLPVQHDDPNRNAPIYHSFEIGRVLFIVSDTRSSRNPISATDDETKTMLGADQMTWMRDTLIASNAEFFVWLTPSPFVHGGAWASYSSESAKLVDMFTELGWIDRMCVVTGDAHYLAIDTGTGAAIGGIPVFVFSGLDSSTGSSSLPYDTGDVSGGKGRYGTIEVVDNGGILHVTGRGFIDTRPVWREYTITVTPRRSGGGGGGGPAPRPDIAVPVSRQEVTWLACDLLSGRIIAELPDITGSVKRVLGAHTSTNLSLPIPLSGPGALGERALQATAYGRVFIVPVVNDVPSAGFIVLTRKGGTDARLDLGCLSLEGYFNRRYVPTMSFTDVDEADIARALVQRANVHGIGYEIDAPRTGTRRDREYVDSDDATIYQRLRELMGVQDGPEWTVDVDWADDSQRSIAKVFRLRKRIGRVREHAVFDTRGPSEARYTYIEDFSGGKGANHVLATSSGEGEDRPEGASGDLADGIMPGWPLYEKRISPSTSIKDESVLVDHARSEFDLVKLGSRTFDVSTRWDAPPRLNLDWALGDTVSWDVVGHRHPQGIRAEGRAISWDLDMQSGTVQPILLDRQGGVL